VNRFDVKVGLGFGLGQERKSGPSTFRLLTMIKWCAWCQEFMHEIAPYDDFSVTHGVCASCNAKHKNLFARDVVARANVLRELFCALFDAGRHEDFDAAACIVENAIAANCKPVDILLGMISPMLYEIGEEWKRGALSVEAEHRFTAFSERVVQLVEARNGTATRIPSSATPLFLMNAPGNQHDLALRILPIWLKGHGAKVRIFENDIHQDRLTQNIAADRPKFLLISMAVTEQCDRVAEIAKTVQALPQDIRPKTIVGGYPVKAGLISSIPETELMSNISALQIA
jgi:methanogenic corrinoid protein MtbC1